jgi:uncharacterized protein involved in outer membrane biogenesis
MRTASRKRGVAARLILWIFALGILLAGTNALGSWVVQHTRIRGRLNARLRSAFGRPVEVGRYSLDLLDGPALEASSISVAEDPRFGHEYFLRADSMTIRLRWLPLLAGHLELGTLSVSRPSLNLVRISDGRWNIEGWLPLPPDLFDHSAPALARPAGVGAAAPRIQRLEFDAGRINFKRGDEKLPFAFTDLTGFAERQSSGRWKLNLDASPARAAVALQQAGTLHLEGQLGGTSSRLRPADLQFSWQDCALADALRLATGYDHGTRGEMSVFFEAHTLGPEWNLQGRAELRRLHRWDLAYRADNPALNVRIRAAWLPEKSEIHFSDAAVDAPRSNLRGVGDVSWAERGDGFADIGRRAAPSFTVTSAGIDLADVMAWVRAFHPGVAQTIALRGRVGGSVTLEGWPLHAARGKFSSEEVALEGGSLREPIRARHAEMALEGESARLLPAEVLIGANGGALRTEGSIAGWGIRGSSFALAGHVVRVEDLTTAASALGWNWPSGWSVEGPANFDLRWTNDGRLAVGEPVGQIELQGINLRAPFLNQPVAGLKGRLEFAGSSRELFVSSAEAFGGEWSGRIDLSPAGAGDHPFALEVDRLNAEDLDRWLNPHWRQGFFGNVLGFLNATSAAAVPQDLQAHGRLAVDQFAFSRFVMRGLDGELVLHGRHLELEDATAEFAGAKISGGLIADVGSNPVYALRAYFSGLNLAGLAADSPVFAKNVGGVASGELTMGFEGVGRGALLGSMKCDGRADIRNALLQGFDLVESLRSGARRAGKTAFARAAAGFTCGGGEIRFSRLQLERADSAFDATGTVDFARNVDFRIRAIRTGADRDAAEGAGVEAAPAVSLNVFRLRGPLFAPQVTRVQTTPRQ